MGLLGCDEVGRELSAYIDGELAEDRAAEVARHLERCPGCWALHASESVVVRRLRARRTPPAPPDVRRRVVERLLEEDRAETGGEPEG